MLEEKDWEVLGDFLSKEKTPLTVMYTPCWVDDGPLDVQSHGLTHLDTNRLGWAGDPGKHRDTSWNHEFFHARIGKEVSIDQQRYSMESSSSKNESLFGAQPIALTPFGHCHDKETDKIAGEVGDALFSADYTGIKKGQRIIRNWKIPAVFLYLKDPSPFATKTGYPLVGVIHDFDGVQSSYLIPIRIVLRKYMMSMEEPIELSDLASRVSNRHEANSVLSITLESSFMNGTVCLDVPLKRNEIFQ